MMPASATERAADMRRKELAAIHVSAKQLDIDRETYVALLTRVANATSSADLDAAGRRAVLDEMRRLGAVNPATKTRRGRAKPGSYPGKPHNANSVAMPDMISKIEAQLADMKLPWSYADAIVRQQHGIDRCAWCRSPEQLRGVIAALHAEQEKRQLGESVDRLLTELGIAPEKMVEMFRPLRPNWRRHRPSLRLVVEHLSELAEKSKHATLTKRQGEME